MAGLIHPESIELWREWAASRDRARRAKHAVTDAARALRRRGQEPAEASEPAWILHSREGEGEGRLLIAVDSGSPTSRASLLASLPYLNAGIDVIAPQDAVLPELAGEEWSRTPFDSPRDAAREQTAAVVSIGQHLPAGAAAHSIAQRRGLPEFVVQHGALTPYAPPLPRDAALLAWSDADAAFWSTRRSDVRAETVGSQLLWQAAHEDRAPAAPEGWDGDRLLFLGQLHGAELPRAVTGGAARAFCRAHDALYRPHPSETDIRSRAQHALWQRRGIALAPTDVALKDLPNPVVAVFSTGVLEAAVRGRDAWVYAPKAPAWVHEFWERYDMRPFGAEPTPAPDATGEEPAAKIARILEEAL